MRVVRVVLRSNSLVYIEDDMARKRVDIYVGALQEQGLVDGDRLT